MLSLTILNDLLLLLLCDLTMRVFLTFVISMQYAVYIIIDTCTWVLMRSFPDHV